MHRVLRLLLLPALVGVLTVGLAGPASAAPIAYDTKTQYLAAHPVDDDPTSCVQRRIYLATATYVWGVYLEFAGNTGHYFPQRNQYLGAGNYTWKDCLDPKNDDYRLTSSLDPDHAGWPTASWTVPVDISPSGYWEWGSYLDPPF